MGGTVSNYMPKKAHHGFKPYDRRQARRDIHEAGIVSHKMSAFVRRQRKDRP